ncbi:MAG: hypothetical protein WCR45_03190 [Bacteroidaceae bacterium]|nr:hypothetical protein [Bacteroidaceae bacterium]
MNRIDETKKFLKSFYEGTTTEEQEDKLLHFFQSDAIPPELRMDKDLFLQMRQRNKIEVPSGLENKISDLIDAENKKEKMRLAKKRKTFYLCFGSIAAGLLIIISSIGFFYKQQNEMSQHTLKNSIVAQAEARKALLLVSSNLNFGMNQLTKAQKKLDKTNRIINKHIY